MTNLNDFLNDQMKDPAFKAEWEALAPEFSVIEAILKARKESSFLKWEIWPCGAQWRFPMMGTL